MAGFVEGVDRGQSTLFPALLDDYIRCESCWPLRQTGLRLCRRRRCLSLSRRRAAHLSLYERRGRKDTAPLLDEHLQNLRDESAVHDRLRAPHLTLGARG